MFPFSPPTWQNDPLVLYHGTLAAHAGSILDGIDLRRAQSHRDFGRGFYTTTRERQAFSWALHLIQLEPAQSPAVIRLGVARDALADQSSE